MPHRSNEFLLPHKLNDIQHQVMIGGLLGDSSLMLDSKYPRMKIDRQRRDRKYLEWQYGIFKELCKSGIKDIERYDKRYDKINKQSSFRTRAVPAFLDYFNKWYINGVKQVPKDLEFTPIILAVWFADDGCIVAHGKNCLTLKLSTESFGKKGATFLANKLSERFKQKFYVRKKDNKNDKDQWVIKAQTAASQAFLKEIEPIIKINGMLRKYNIWKDRDLNKPPKIGREDRAHLKLYKTILELKDFSVDTLAEIMTEYKRGTIIGFVKKFYKAKYLTRYESTDKFKLYHYILAPAGKKFFENKIKKSQ